ncbi:hypothetical protein KKA00_10785 [bacterium]|nr:hypothetical protein [bacterium]MBU1652697.1 hypothetical protein [bacterium]MBU1881603.1 hypothetical protein [bacterium]
MTLIRLLLLGLLSYFIVRMFRGVGSRKNAKVNQQKKQRMRNPFGSADIQDVSYTEIEDNEEDKSN